MVLEPEKIDQRQVALGSSADRMTMAIAHRLGDVAGNPVAIFARECCAGIFHAVEKLPASCRHWRSVCRRMAAQAIHAERYPVSAFGTNEGRDLSKLPLLNSRKVELPRLASQFCGLERRTARGGRDSIDHSPGAHDDIANAAAGALLLTAARPPIRISEEALALSARPGPAARAFF